jgi:hypothetical protein
VRLVLDTCACVDLCHGEILEKVTDLHDILIPNILERELKQPSFSQILRAGHL